MSLPLLKETINHPRDETCGGKEGVIVMKAKRNRRNTAVGEALRIFFFFCACSVQYMISSVGQQKVLSIQLLHITRGVELLND